MVVVPVRHPCRRRDDDDDALLVSSSSFSLFVVLRTSKESQSPDRTLNERTNEDVDDEINPKEKERFSNFV